MDLKQARALVTGGGSGIGRAVAAELVRRGASVIICGRDREKLARAAHETGASAFPADVSDEAAAVALVRHVIERFPDYNVLINNAGFGAWASLVDTTSTEFHSVWATNVLGAMLVARESARHFIHRGSGNIVNVASTAARRGYANGTSYVASKFALAGMTECWRAELRQHDVRVMQINPSEVQTEFFGDRRAGLDPSKLVSEDIAHVVCAMLELDDRGFVPDATVWATNPRS